MVDFKSCCLFILEAFVSINDVFCVFSYRENAARISKSIKLRPRSAIEEAAEWVEYAQAQGDLSFLRPRSLDLPFYQLYLMDVFTLFIFLLIIVVAAVYLLLRCSYRLCLRKKLIKEKSF